MITLADVPEVDKDVFKSGVVRYTSQDAAIGCQRYRRQRPPLLQETIDQFAGYMLRICG